MPRPSHIRSSIAALVSESDRHGWTIEDVSAGLEERGVRADASSVFRGLVRLADDGVIDSLELGDGRVRYEARTEHHEHITCTSCGKVGAVPGCLVEQAIPRVEGATGFRVTSHRLNFTGLCTQCTTAAG